MILLLQKYRFFLICIMIGFAVAGGMISCKYDPGSELDDPMDKFSSRPFIEVTEPAGSTSEAGGTTTFSLRLALQPSADVTIAIESGDETEGTVSPATLSFTPDNWNVYQTITVTGTDDSVYDLDQSYEISFTSGSSDDSYFNERTMTTTVTITNTDDETPVDALAAANFSLLRVGGVCPTGFTDDGLLRLDTEDTNDSSSLSGSTGDATFSSGKINLRFCSTNTASVNNVNNMKLQSFIVLRDNNTCPSGYSPGTIAMDTEDSHHASEKWGNIGDSYVSDDFVTLYACDSAGDATLNSLQTSTFTVFQNGDCPDGSQEGTIKVDTEDTNNADYFTGDIGSSYTSSDNTFSVYLKVCTFQ